MKNYIKQIERAQLLIQQDRIDLAEETLRSAIGEEPDEGVAYSLLAIVVLEKKAYDDSQQLAERGLALNPDISYGHFVLSLVHFRRDKYRLALESIEAAIELDPTDADYYGQKAAIELAQSQWERALESTETGLQFDPEDVQCNNLRAIALTKLGRRDEAGATIETALAASPENPATHANMGWTRLHESKPLEAAEHFKEALRLDPDNDWARQGIIESLKARSFLYRQFLKYTMWISSFTPRTQLMLFVGIIVLLQVLIRMPEEGPLHTIGIVLALSYVAFATSVWLASPLFDLLLRFDRFGRLVLTDEKRADTNWMALAFIVVAGLLSGPLLTGVRLFNTIDYMLLLVAVAVTLGTPRAAKRSLAAGLTCVCFAMAMVCWYRWYVDMGLPAEINNHESLQRFLKSRPQLTDPHAPAVVDFFNQQDRLNNWFVWLAVGMTWFSSYFRKRAK